MKRAEVTAIARSVARAIKKFELRMVKPIDEHVRGYLEPLIKDIEKLFEEDRAVIRELKSAVEESPFRYVGTYKSGREYTPGNFVTHAGGMWHCDEPTKETPGKCNSWTLAVKSGGK